MRKSCSSKSGKGRLGVIGDEFTMVMSNDSSGEAAVRDSPISPPSLSWKYQDRVERWDAVDPLDHVGEQAVV